MLTSHSSLTVETDFWKIPRGWDVLNYCVQIQGKYCDQDDLKVTSPNPSDLPLAKSKILVGLVLVLIKPVF